MVNNNGNASNSRLGSNNSGGGTTDSSLHSKDSSGTTVFYKRLFLFDGRASVREFWKMTLTILAMAALPIAMLVVDGVFMEYGHEDETSLGVVISWLALFPLAFAFWAISARRLQDMNLPGWLALLFFLLFLAYGINILAAIVFFVIVGCLDGTPGENRFGQDPLGRNDALIEPRPFKILRTFSAVNSAAGWIVILFGIIMAAIAYNYANNEMSYYDWSVGHRVYPSEYPYRQFFWPIVVATFFLSVNSLVLGAFTRSQVAIADKIEKLVGTSNPGMQNRWLLFAAWCNRIAAALIAIVGIYMPTYFRIQDNEKETFLSLFMAPLFLFFGWLAEGIAEIFFCQAWCEAAMSGNDASDSINDTPKTAHNSLLINQSTQRKEPDSSKREVGAKKTESILTLENLADSMIAIPDKGYSICKFEVTQSLWNTIMENNPSHFKGADRPVDSVSWDDCQRFLEKLNARPKVKESGLIYRHPTAEEWMFTCCAGATGDYCKLSNGTEITKNTLNEVAWFNANSDDQTHPVGQKVPNAFGLYDMLGNVWEWVVDSNFSQAVFGGSWGSAADGCQSESCFKNPESLKGCVIGFRLACDVVK